jgi:hypothetical protein
LLSISAKNCTSNPGSLLPNDQNLKALWAFQSGRTSFILILAMTKRKPGKFSATKAVKANARERVGQPKPVRVIDTEPRTGRATKHKPKLEEIMRQED